MTCQGRTQEGAFQPGYTTLRNPKVQAEVSRSIFTITTMFLTLLQFAFMQNSPDDRSHLIVDSTLKDVHYGQKVPLVGHFYGSKTKSIKIYLGEARTDEQGRLVVLAGHGESKSVTNKDDPYPYIPTEFDSPDWIDDTSDGWISVHIKSTKTHTS